MSRLFDSISENIKDKIKKEKQPGWMNPMLATLSHEHFSEEGWIYERKFDGVRCLVFKSGKNLRLMSRNQKNISKTYPELVGPLLEQSPDNFILDGEIVTFKGNVTSFSRLQDRINVKKPFELLINKIGVYLYVFDILYLEKFNLSDLPLHYRKRLLKEAMNLQQPSTRKKGGIKFTSTASVTPMPRLV